MVSAALHHRVWKHLPAESFMCQTRQVCWQYGHPERSSFKARCERTGDHILRQSRPHVATFFQQCEHESWTTFSWEHWLFQWTGLATTRTPASLETSQFLVRDGEKTGWRAHVETYYSCVWHVHHLWPLKHKKRCPGLLKWSNHMLRKLKRTLVVVDVVTWKTTHYWTSRCVPNWP